MIGFWFGWEDGLPGQDVVDSGASCHTKPSPYCLHDYKPSLPATRPCARKRQRIILSNILKDTADQCKCKRADAVQM